MNTYARDQHLIVFVLSVVGWAFFPLPPAFPLLPNGSQWEKMPGRVKRVSPASVLEVSYHLLIF